MKIRLYCVIFFYNGGEGGLFDQYKGCIIESFEMEVPILHYVVILFHSNISD